MNQSSGSAGNPEYYLKKFHSSSRLLVSPSICCPELKGNVGFRERARAAEHAITAYPSRFSVLLSLSKATQERRRRAHPSDGRAAPLSLVLLTPVFSLPLQSPFLFHSASSLVLLRLIGPSVATPPSLFLRRLYFAPSCSEAILPLLSGAFFTPFSPPLSLSPTFSHTRLTLILIFTYQDGSVTFRRVNEE